MSGLTLRDVMTDDDLDRLVAIARRFSFEDVIKILVLDGMAGLTVETSARLAELARQPGTQRAVFASELRSLLYSPSAGTVQDFIKKWEWLTAAPQP